MKQSFRSAFALMGRYVLPIFLGLALAHAQAAVAANYKPQLTVISPSKTHYNTEELVSFRGRAIDREDGDISRQIRWYSNRDGWLSGNVRLSAGRHQMSALVSDSGGQQAYSFFVLFVDEPAPNTAPSLTVLSPSRTTFSSTETISFRGRAEDREEGDLSDQIRWYSNRDGWVNSRQRLSVGRHQMSALVADSEGLKGSSFFVLYVEEPEPNEAPTLTVLSPSKTNFAANETVSFRGRAVDPEDGDISSQIRWYSNVDGWVSGSQKLSPGRHQMSALVADSAGLKSSKFFVLFVERPANTAPNLTVLSPGNVSVTTNDTVRFRGRAIDAEDGDISARIRWYSNRDGWLNANTRLSAGRHQMSAVVADSAGLKGSSFFVVQVAAASNTAPQLTVLSPGKSEFLSSETVRFRGRAIDAEDGDISDEIRWYSNRDGWVGANTRLSAGRHQMSAVVADSGGMKGSSFFVLQVEESDSSEATLRINWSAPLAREDGSGLSFGEIGGYQIYLLDNANRERVITVNDSRATSYSLGVERGKTYTIAVSSFDTANRYSRPSRRVQVRVN